MSSLEQLTQYIKKLSADAVDTLLDAVKVLLAAVLASSARGMLMQLRPTGQSRMWRNWQGSIQAISPRTPWYCAMDSKATRALLLLQAVS